MMLVRKHTVSCTHVTAHNSMRSSSCRQQRHTKVLAVLGCNKVFSENCSILHCMSSKRTCGMAIACKPVLG